MFFQITTVILFFLCCWFAYGNYKLYIKSLEVIENCSTQLSVQQAEMTLFKNKLAEKEKVELLLANWIIGITDDELDAEDYEDDCAYIESKEILERQQYVQG